MKDCIFSAHCTEPLCDNSCPVYAETSYLLERNGLYMNNPVFQADNSSIQKAIGYLNESQGKFKVVHGNSTTKVADLITYCAICNNWRGNQLHCNVYNLKYSRYIELLKQSWSAKGEISELEYMKIWASSCKILIVSALDFVSFGDFECQTMLSILQSRSIPDKSTLIVSPPVNQLIGKGVFFQRLKSVLGGGEV